MKDYIFTLRFAAEDDVDAAKFGDRLREAVGKISIQEKLGRYLGDASVEAAMLTRDIVARPLPDRL